MSGSVVTAGPIDLASLTDDERASLQASARDAIAEITHDSAILTCFDPWFRYPVWPGAIILVI